MLRLHLKGDAEPTEAEDDLMLFADMAITLKELDLAIREFEIAELNRYE